MSSVIELNSQYYAVTNLVQSYVTPLSQAYRTTGVQLRSDNPNVNRYVHRGFPLGLGWQRMNRETGRGVGGMLYATCWTALGPVTNGKLQETQTHAAPADHFIKAVNFKGDFWGMFEQDYSATLLNCINVTKWGASTDTWVAVDAPMYNDSTAGTASAASSITVSHTVQATLGNRIVIAFVYTVPSAGSGDPTGVTYAGSAMTKLSSVGSTGGANVRCSLWYLVAPTTGANDCVASFNGSMSRMVMHVADYYFVNQTTPFGTAGTDTGTSTSTSASVTTVAGDLVVGGVAHNVEEAVAVGAGQYEREDTSLTTMSGEYSEERATGTSTAWTASWATSTEYATVAAPLLAAGFVAAPESTVAEGVRAFDIVAHKGSLFLVGNGSPTGETIYKVVSSSDGDAWTDASGTNWPDNTGTNRYLTTTITRRNNSTVFDDMARLCSYGNTLLAAIYRHPSSTDGATLSDIQVLSSTDSGVNWASDVTIPSGDGPKALLEWKDRTATRAPVLVTAEGVYSISISGDTFDLIYALDGDPNNGRWAVVGNDGYLYIGLGSGGVIALNIPSSGTLEVIRVGPPGDGLVTASQGHVNYMLVTPTKWLLVAYGGHAASRNASIFMIDTSVILKDPETGESYMPWHPLWEDATGNLDIVAMAYSTEDDATERLHFAVEGTAASINYHIEEPFANPAQTSTVKYQASSILRKPVDDLGDPETNSTIVQGLVDADDLGATATTSTEYITESYGLDGAADTTTTLGNYLSGDKDLSFGSGAGVAGKKIGRRLTFYRNTAGTPVTTRTAKLYESELQAVNLLLGKRQWTFVVDVEKTVPLASPDLAANTPVQETIIANLLTAATSTTMVTFTAGRLTQTRVRVPEGSPPVLNLEVKDADASNAGYRTGFVTMTVVEGV